MILVLTYKEFEQGTEPVIDWLLYNKANFIVLTYEDLWEHDNLSVDVKNGRILVKGIDLVKEINVIFYRRFEDSIRLEISETKHNSQIIKELEGELRDLTSYFFFLLKDKKWFPRYDKINVDKLTALRVAYQNGFAIPDTIITTSKSEAYSFVRDRNVVIKPICFSGYFVEGDSTFLNYTTNINCSDILNLKKDSFFPTLFQEKIKSMYEIRTFVIENEVYATIIVTEDKTHSDIKTLFGKSTINWEPYKLPSIIHQNLIATMRQLQLNTSSIDLLRDEKGQYYFIDINPVGQYLAPSIRSNYYIEKIIAEWLIKNDC